MALRLPIKITRNFIQNLGKVFYSGKPTIKPVCNLNEGNTAKPATQEGNIRKNSIYGTHVSSLSQKLPISSEAKVSEAEILQDSMGKNHLQPSKLGEYYKPPTDINSGTYPKLENSEMEQLRGASKYRTFEKSTTYKNVKLPLKKPKLVSPFPDPVKVMPSDTLSDQEKADIKEAEARCAKSDAKIPINFTQCRNYSKKAKSGSSKCKKLGKKKKICPAAKVPCKSGGAKKKICEDNYKFKPCKKKKAPYQSYSESCHTIPDEKPSECKMCPWKPSEHPTFKPPKKKFHTSSISFSPKKRQREKQQLKADSNRDWVKHEKWTTCLIETIHEIHVNPLLCKKKPCAPPPSNCKPKKKKKKGKKKKNKKGKKDKKGNCGKPKKKAATIDSNRSWVTLEDPSVQEFPTLFNHRTVPYIFKSKEKTKGTGPGNFKKFPFRGCNLNKPMEEDATPICCKTNFWNNQGVEACPDTCKNSTQRIYNSFEYLLGKSKKPKCPKISPGKCEKEPDDPCGKIRKGTTRECPTDLLKKKRRKPINPKKKTQGVGTPSACQHTDAPSTSGYHNSY